MPPSSHQRKSVYCKPICIHKFIASVRRDADTDTVQLPRKNKKILTLPPPLAEFWDNFLNNRQHNSECQRSPPQPLPQMGKRPCSKVPCQKQKRNGAPSKSKCALDRKKGSSRIRKAQHCDCHARRCYLHKKDPSLAKKKLLFCRFLHYVVDFLTFLAPILTHGINSIPRA